ncbi:MAG: tRNA guanosine(34) transglycosylase Tgt [Candidatus Wildermuthbacteria bacterium]|nr:tRNA guanosine(34) transglycosylase Tgt [Candidatus Wildermuthbacteria bacterium]
MKFFEIEKQSKKSKARLGVIHTKHGDIHTPAFVTVATKGTLKTIPPKEIKDIGIQVAFVNTFHLALHPGVDVIKKMGGIHKYAKLSIPLMSDSAGFQVFSLANKKARTREGTEVPLVRIEEDGVRFRSPTDGREFWFSPEVSMKNQEKIGADLLMAFDECIPAGASHEYTKSATERTHRWLKRCIEAKQRKDQRLYGIIQGGQFKDLRTASAQFVSAQDVDGIAIGGVSVGETKKQMRDQVSWALPHTPPELPRHLLGVGRAEDILDLVVLGIDTFDCVEPTRLARNGIVFQQRREKAERLDLAKSKYAKDPSPIQKGCSCYACKNFSLSFLHHLFKERELLGYYLATWHNLFFFENLFSKIRRDIGRGRL